MRALVTFAIVALGLAAIGAAPDRTILRGYTVPDSVRERAIETQFVDIPSAQRALDVAATIEARPHAAGSTGDYALAVFMRDAMRAAGIGAELEAFTTTVDTPRELRLAYEPASATHEPAPAERGRHGRRAADLPIALDLGEIAEPSDPPTAARGIGLPFNAGSADGDVRGPLVFADRGLTADYATLGRAGIDVRGAIVLVRYGAEFRGLLAERAQAHGAAGTLFYSDPKDDGATRGSVYPNGPWRPATAIGRGWVGPNVRIPTLPISAANALLLLRSLRGDPAPPGWGGTLPVDYPLARGPGRVHLIVKLTRKPATLWNTVGVIPGVRPDQSVILGAHRDAWVYGVGDNGAGIITMLEVARGLGFLWQGGWRPQRTIVIAGWDGEEIGLAGSRAYVQRHRLDLERGCVAYLNADQNVTGTHFSVEAVSALGPLVTAATHDIHDPLAATGSVFDRWAAQSPGGTPAVGVPGGGSDHQSFLSALGIPVASLGFAGPFGVDHSSYDTLRYATLYSDPGFVVHRATAALYGVVALRLADADAIPYAWGGYATALRRAAADVATGLRGDGSAADPRPLARAVDRFAATTAAADALVGVADASISARELRAARIADTLVYGVSGDAAVAFPAIDAARATHDTATIDAAIGGGIDALDRAAAALSGQATVR